MWSDGLVFCDYGFQSVCPLMEKDKRLMEASWWERLTLGKLGLILMGWAIISKSLIQFSVDGWGYVSSLLFWKWKWKLLSCVWLFATPRTIQPWNSPGQDTGVDNLSLLQGILPTQGSNPGLPHCRWILYQLSHTWHQTMVEVMKIMVTSFKKSHAHTATLSAPNPAAGHHWPTPLLETPGHSQASVGQLFIILELHHVCSDQK